MFDAEIAATLLNRWARHVAPDEGDWYLELLREGNLAFTRECGSLGLRGLDDMASCVVESLYFTDGSSALRVASPYREGGWTEWTALQPLRRFALQ
jgi:hypothetical protein